MRAAIALAALLLLAVPVSAEERLVLLDEGPAAHYSPSYDYGGWQAIIARRIAWGQHDPDTFPYSDEGYYCVRPGFAFGNIITLTNPRTGTTIRCTVADSVAARDQAHWWAHVVIEMSWAAFVALDLDEGNLVDLYVV